MWEVLYPACLRHVVRTVYEAISARVLINPGFFTVLEAVSH